MKKNYFRFMKWCPGCCQPMYNSNMWCRSCHKEVVHQLHNRPMPACKPPWEDIYTCTFHVFFHSIGETEGAAGVYYADGKGTLNQIIVPVEMLEQLAIENNVPVLPRSRV